MNVETLSDLFVVELNRTYAVERRLAEVLATLEADANVDALDDRGHVDLREELTAAIAEHRAETDDHVARLEDAFDALDRRPDERSTPALDGLVGEKELFNNVVLNDALRPIYYVWTGQEIERLEITAYERLCRLAEHLDVPEAVGEALERNLSEERAALERLRELAEDDAVSDLLSDLAASPAST